jgi:hypothetical protein
MKTSDVLRGAADHIEKVGLHKGWYFKSDPEHVLTGFSAVEPRKGELQDVPCCTIGGIYMAAETAADASNAERELAARIDRMRYESVPDWSDRYSQRKGRVVAKLRRVAAELDEVAA